MNNKLILTSVFAFIMLMGLSLAASPIVFNYPSDGSTFSEPVDYSITLNVPAENVIDLDIFFYDSTTYDVVGAITDNSGVNESAGTFSAPQDGSYSIYVALEYSDGSVIFPDSREIFFTINNDLKVLGYLNPTPEDGDLINSQNIGSAMIIAVANGDTDSFNVFLENETDVFDYDYFPFRETDFSFMDYWNVDFSDGVYTFYSEAESGLETSRSPMRTITIKATVPNVTEYNASFPDSVNEDAEFSVILSNVVVSEGNVTLEITASNNNDYESLGLNTMGELSTNRLTFPASITNPGVYNLTLTISDNYGNSNSYSLGEMSVNDVAEPNPVEERRRGRGGSSNTVVNDTNPSSRFNLTLIDLNEENEEQTGNETGSETEEQPGFFSFITGAVTGAFSTPPRAVLTFLIIIIIIYAIIKIRGYIVADSNTANKPKKNGKKAKKEEVEESESN